MRSCSRRGLSGSYFDGGAFVRSFFPPDPVRTQAKQISDLYTIVFLFAAAIFFLVEGLIMWTVIRYRRKPGDDELPPQTHGHNLAEITWTVVPTIIVAFLFFISWQTLNSVEAEGAQPDLRSAPSPASSSGRSTTSPRTAWTRGVFSLTLRTAPMAAWCCRPARPRSSTSRAGDVIHAFYVPQFLFKRDVVPGQINQFDFTIDDEGCRPDLPRPVRGAVRDRATGS